MNQGVLWRLVIAVPLLFSITGAVPGAEVESADEEQLPVVFEELSFLDPPATLSSHHTCVPEQPSCVPAPCVPAPTCGSSTGCGYTCSDCDTCCNYCGDTCCRFIAGVETTFLAPQSSGLRSVGVGNDIAGATIYRVSEQADFDGMTFAPRMWIGVQGAEWGLVSRFWYLSDSDDQFHPFDQPAGGTPGTFTDDRLKAYTADWEFVRGCCWCGNKFDFTVGGRYVGMEADSAVSVAGLANGGLDFFHATAMSDIEFDGIGVTTSIGGRIPLKECCGCVYLLWNVRGSVLWGESSNSVQTTATTIGAAANGTSIDSATVSDDSSMYIVEAQLGAQWEHELRCMPAAAFFKIAAEYQFWDVSTGEVGTVSSAAIATSSALARANSGDFDLNLLGFTVGTGLTW